MARHPRSSEANGEHKRAARSRMRIEEGLQRLRAEASPATRALSTAPVALPDVEAPSLEDLVIAMVEPPDITADDLVQRLHDELRAVAPRRERAAGEPCALGDEIVIDTLGYADGMLLPFSVRSGLVTELKELPFLPGLAAGIAGMKVGEGRVVSLAFPPDYPVERWGGKAARVIVDLHAAYELDVPDPTTAQGLAALGRGATLDDVMASLRAELDQELGDALLLEAQGRVLDELARRVGASVPAAAVDEEITRHWGQLEGGALTRKGFRKEEQEEALALWKQDPELRRDAERRIQVALALKAIAARDGVEVTRADVQELVAVAAEVMGITPAEASRALKEERAEAARVVEIARHLKAVEHVMAKARFLFPEDA